MKLTIEIVGAIEEKNTSAIRNEIDKILEKNFQTYKLVWEVVKGVEIKE